MRGEIAKGAAWMVLFRLFDRSVGLISTAVLARLLVPNDFGLVAMAMSIIVFIELATAFGFEIALIQMKEPQREHFDTAWSLNLLLACGGALVTALAAQPAAAFYGDARLVTVMLTIAAAWFVGGFENIGIVSFRRELNFAAEFRFLAIKRVASFAVTMVCAFQFRSYWALVIGMAAGRGIGVVLSYWVHPFRPRPTLIHARQLFSFSGWLLVNSALSVAVNRVPHLFVGRAFGAQALGAYTVASEIALLAQTELIAPINRAMFPGYARLVSDPPLFRRTCVDATSLILLIALPVSVGIAVLAGPFVRLLLGAQWSESVALIQVLAVSATLSALTSNNASIYLAMGRPHLATTALATRLVVMLIGLALLDRTMGAKGVAYAALAAALAALLVSLPTLFTAIHIKAGRYLGALWRPLIASALMGWVVSVWVKPGFHAERAASAVAELLAGTLIGMVVYLAAMALLWRIGGTQDAVEAQIVRRLMAEFRTRRAAARRAP